MQKQSVGISKRVISAAASASIVCAAVSCGGDDGGAEGELQEITIGVIPIATMSAIQYGLDEGIFEAHGLDVTIETGTGGASLLPALQAGQLDFVIGNASNLLLAVDQGLDMRVVSGYSHSLEDGYDINGVAVRAEDGIDSWSDLEGQTVAVNAIRGQGDLTIMEAVERDGGDPSAVDFTESEFVDMEAQLEVGNIDAAWLPEPFLDYAVSQEEFDLIGHPNQVIPGLPTVVSFTTGEIVEGESELIDQYQAAIEEIVEEFVNDPNGAVESVMEFMDLPEDIAEDSIHFDQFGSEIREDQIRELAGLMVKYEFIDDEPDMEGLFVE